MTADTVGLRAAQTFSKLNDLAAGFRRLLPRTADRDYNRRPSPTKAKLLG